MEVNIETIEMYITDCELKLNEIKHRIKFKNKKIRELKNKREILLYLISEYSKILKIIKDKSTKNEVNE